MIHSSHVKWLDYMYTRRGDKGETSLFGPRRVSKDSPRVEAYGTIDELNSFLGVVLSDCRDKKITASLEDIQRMLFVAGADLAADASAAGVPRISSRDTLRVEKMTDEALKRLPTLKNFILPGGFRVASELQFARTICRRAERRVITASRGENINPELVPFLNRLSSYLFNLARLVNQKQKVKERVWKS